MDDRIADDAVLQRAPGTLWRRLLDGVLVQASVMDEPLRISSPGDLMWILLQEPVTMADLVETLSTHYRTPVQTVRTDIEPTLLALHEAGALSVISGTP